MEKPSLDPKIASAIAELSPELKTKHKEALAEGHTDDVCPRCDQVLLAHQHFLRCRDTECPQVSRGADGKPLTLLDLAAGAEPARRP